MAVTDYPNYPAVPAVSLLMNLQAKILAIESPGLELFPEPSLFHLPTSPGSFQEPWQVGGTLNLWEFLSESQLDTV